MELRAEELRIGNYFEYCGNYYKSTGFLPLATYYQSKEDIGERLVYLTYIKPIPLTEEILLKCFRLDTQRHKELLYKSCFEYNDLEERFTFYGVNMCEYILDKQDDWWFIGIKHSKSINYFVWDIKFLHQLQNLYYCLTGQELTVKL